jgi:hypothetical protein
VPIESTTVFTNDVNRARDAVAPLRFGYETSK